MPPVTVLEFCKFHPATPVAKFGFETNSGPKVSSLTNTVVEVALAVKPVKLNVGVVTLPEKVAFCGGSGSFLLNNAKRIGADIFITGDFKYHEFFDAEDELVIADIGHFESEQYTSMLLERILTKKFTKFAVLITEINTNPINYF